MLKNYPRYAVQTGYISKPRPLSARPSRGRPDAPRALENQRADSRSRSRSRSRSPIRPRLPAWVWKRLFRRSRKPDIPARPTRVSLPPPARSSLRSRNSASRSSGSEPNTAAKRVTFVDQE
ncbi:hypothetical protein GLOTRDRAFT_128698 [Gloeophyllum trabeum ATCC 11539]|uniref:Uncharacterized protein n=1 Tax=Gloeophyllum trabeum (strain ATCC 11539 / FP-39264 / Madison 617) TaxID=670483 RepID=S7QA28_GLOTA|nr:uncharacterized protein GLOTRDRAFT_128698 [Gloeophyllum trabeum ATCC 11539]EPQ56761.1 hypothetical protein GLOTRDRAFT_128698 [Gloeophyllum trabeum ATCC 11539]